MGLQAYLISFDNDCEQLPEGYMDSNWMGWEEISSVVYDGHTATCAGCGSPMYYFQAPSKVAAYRSFHRCTECGIGYEF